MAPKAAKSIERMVNDLINDNRDDVDKHGEYVEQTVFNLHDLIASDDGYDAAAERVLILLRKLLALVPRKYINAVGQFLGSGGYGAAWTLGDDKVFKLFYDPTGRQYRYYVAAQRRHKAGKATEHTVDIDAIVKLDKQWFFVVQTRLEAPDIRIMISMSINRWLNSANTKEEFITRALNDYKRRKDDLPFVSTEPVPDESDVRQLLAAAWDVKETEGGTSADYDMGPRNYGFRPGTRIPVFFDPVDEGRKIRPQKDYLNEALRAIELEYLRLHENRC